MKIFSPPTATPARIRWAGQKNNLVWVASTGRQDRPFQSQYEEMGRIPLPKRSRTPRRIDMMRTSEPYLFHGNTAGRVGSWRCAVPARLLRVFLLLSPNGRGCAQSFPAYPANLPPVRP